MVLEYKLPVDGLEIFLRRHSAAGCAGLPVLLIHGGNTNSKMYSEPNGGLVKYLLERERDVWTLDWRCSEAVVAPLQRRGPLGDSIQKERELYTLDRAASQDIPSALSQMRAAGVTGEIGVLGFCLGGGSLSMAVSRGYLEKLGVGNVVLVTMGLFYEVPWNGWIKAEDYIIERMLGSAPNCRVIDPAHPEEWPAEMSSAYERWPRSWLPPGNEPIDVLFQHLTFMYGEPYARGRLTRAFEERLLTGFFGPVVVGTYLHAGQNVRRGYAARNNEPDVVDRSRLDVPPGNQTAIRGDLRPKYFKNKRVTSVAGADDRLWHRDSMDLMYEWLRNECAAPRERARHRKHVFAHYGHLDLFWSEDAQRDV
ncbi:MAG TPA: hypothetical protein VGM29_11440, partial [Polyangiaceae bacterium]